MASSSEEDVDEAAERFEAASLAAEKASALANAQAQAVSAEAAKVAPAPGTTGDSGGRPFINSAIDFFACIGTGSTLEVDNESGMFSPEALHESWEYAITDVGVVLMDKGETVPPGWEYICTTAGGTSEPVNITPGSFLKRCQTALCVRRRKHSRSSRQLVDVCVGYGGRVPSGYEAVRRTVSGAFDASVSRQSVYETFLCVKYAAANGSHPNDAVAAAGSSDSPGSPGGLSGSDVSNNNNSGSSDPHAHFFHTERSVADLAVFLPGKGERAPAAFVERGGNLNRGMNTTRVQLALRFGPRLGLCDMPLVPHVLDRLPLGRITVHREGNDDLGGTSGSGGEAAGGGGGGGDVFELAFPEAVPMFCFPRGVRLKRSSKFDQPPPSAFSYVFTEDMGRRVYVSCLVFYEEVPSAKVGALLSQYLPVQTFWDTFGSDEEEEGDDNNDDNEDGNSGEKPRRRRSSSATSPTVTAAAAGGGGGRRNSDAVPPNHLLASTPNSSGDMRVWAPQCLCLMSHWPAYGALRTALRHLWSLSLGKSKVPLERHLAAMFATPMPRPGAAPIHLQLDLGLVDSAQGEVAALAPIILHQPALRGLPLMDLDFTMPFHSLSLERLVAVFGLMLRETPMLFLSASATRLADTIEVLRALLFPLDYKVAYVPRLPDKLRHYLEAPMGFVMGMVIDSAEYGSADGPESPAQLVRQLHESLGGCDAPVGVAVVALDEDRLYEAGGKHARGAPTPKINDVTGAEMSEKDDAEAWLDDKRLCKEGIAVLPLDAAAWLKARLTALQIPATPGLRTVKHFDSPFQHASIDDFAGGGFNGTAEEADASTSSAAVAAAAAALEEEALTGISGATVGIRDAFLTCMALILGAYRSCLRTPDALAALQSAVDHHGGSHSRRQNNSNNSSKGNGNKSQNGNGNGEDDDLGTCLAATGVDEWFDFEAFIAEFGGKRDQIVAKQVCGTQMFSSLVQQTIEASESDVRLLFFDEYCEVLAQRLARLPGHTSQGALAAAAFVHGSAQSSLANSLHGRNTSSSASTSSSPAHSSKASHDLSSVAERLITGGSGSSPSPASSPHSGGSSSGNGLKSGNGRGTALTALLDSAAVLAAAVALPPLITEMGLGESEPATFEALFSSSNDFSNSPRPTPTPDRSSHGSDNPTPDRPQDKASNSEDGQSTTAATAATATSDEAATVAADGSNEVKTNDENGTELSPASASDVTQGGGSSGESIEGYGKPVIVRRATLEPSTTSSSSSSSSSSNHHHVTNSPRASGLGGPPHRRLPGASRSFNLGSRRDGSGSRGSTNSPSRHGGHPNHHLPDWLASALPSGGGSGGRGIGGRRLQKRVVPGALPENGGVANSGAGNAAGGNGTSGAGGSGSGGDLYEYPNGWPSSLDPSLLYHSEAQVPPALQALRLESSTQDRGFMARQLLTRSKGERRRRGSVMQMDPLQRPVHALAQVLAAYLSCLPARVTSGLAQRQHHSAEDDVEADSVNAGASNKSSNSSGSGNARSQKASSECEPVREVLRALGAVFHLEFTGHASLLDEAAWRSLLIACGHVGGAGMRRLAVRVEEAMTKALGRAPNVVTMGQFYRALTVGNAARGQKTKKKAKSNSDGASSSSAAAAAEELSSWVPVVPPSLATQPDPFLWLELSGVVWCRARAVDGLWQALVDRVKSPSLQRLLMHRREPICAPGRGFFADLASAVAPPPRIYPLNNGALYPPWHLAEPPTNAGGAKSTSANNAADAAPETATKDHNISNGSVTKEAPQGAVAARLIGMWSDGPCPFCNVRMLDEEILAAQANYQPGLANGLLGSSANGGGGGGAGTNSGSGGAAADGGNGGNGGGGSGDDGEALVVTCRGCSRDFYPTLKWRIFTQFYPATTTQPATSSGAEVEGEGAGVEASGSPLSLSAENPAAVPGLMRRAVSAPAPQLQKSASSLSVDLPHVARASSWVDAGAPSTSAAGQDHATAAASTAAAASSSSSSAVFSKRVRRLSMTGAMASAVASLRGSFTSTGGSKEVDDSNSSSSSSGGGGDNSDPAGAAASAASPSAASAETAEDNGNEENGAGSSSGEGNESDDTALGGVLSEVDWGDSSGDGDEIEGVALYLSASVLRLRLDEVLLEFGEGVLATNGRWLRAHRPHVFWNLLWYASRLAMPLPFPDAPRAQSLRSNNQSNNIQNSSNGSPVTVVSRCLTGWEERVVCAQCQWLMGAAQHAPSHAAASKDSPTAGGAQGADTAPVSGSSASESSLSSSALPAPPPSFSVRGADHQWWPLPVDASQCVAAAMRQAASQGQEGGVVLLPARRTTANIAAAANSDRACEGEVTDGGVNNNDNDVNSGDQHPGEAASPTSTSGVVPSPPRPRALSSYTSSRLELRWGSEATSGAHAAGSPTGMLQVNLDTQAVAIVRRDFHDPIPGGPPAFLDWEPLSPSPATTDADATSSERFSLSSLASHAQEVVNNPMEHGDDAMPSETNPALASALSRPRALIAREEGEDGGGAKAELSGPLFKPPPMGEFTGGAGVLAVSEDDEESGGSVKEGGQVLSRLEVLSLWQPARLPLVALFPICADDDNNFKALVKIAESLLSDYSSKKTASAVMAFVQHTSHLLYMEGSLKARRESATAAKMAAATSSAAAAAAAAVQGQSEGGEEDLQRGDHNAKASDNDNDEDEEEEEEDSGLTARSVFTLPSFYRTLVTVAGHYDGGCGGAGVVVGPVAAPAALLPSSSSPKTASPLAPSDTATWGGFGPSRNNSMAASASRDQAAYLALASVGSSGSHAPGGQGSGSSMSAILARRNGASPFDGSLRRAVSSLGLPELQDYDVESETALMASAPPPAAVHFRSVFGHLY